MTEIWGHLHGNESLVKMIYFLSQSSYIPCRSTCISADKSSQSLLLLTTKPPSLRYLNLMEEHLLKRKPRHHQENFQAPYSIVPGVPLPFPRKSSLNGHQQQLLKLWVQCIVQTWVLIHFLFVSPFHETPMPRLNCSLLFYQRWHTSSLSMICLPIQITHVLSV